MKKNKKVHLYYQFQIGFLFTVTKWYKGQRTWVLSFPFVDVNIEQIHSKYKNKKKSI